MNAVVEAARGWIGTPYVHQASVRGAGTDCLGLIRGVWREVYGAEPEAVPVYSRDWSEAGTEEALWAAALRHLVPKEGAAPGDVILFRMRDGAVAKHLGIQGNVVGCAVPEVGEKGCAVPRGGAFAPPRGGGAAQPGVPPGGCLDRSAAQDALTSGGAGGQPRGFARSRLDHSTGLIAAARTGAHPTFIHAWSGHAVVESPLSAPWARRIVARFAFPELTEV